MHTNTAHIVNLRTFFSLLHVQKNTFFQFQSKVCHKFEKK